MTETQTVDLAAWLTAVWDEEERLASDDLTPGPWTLEYECPEGKHDHDWDEVWIAGQGRSTVAGFNERYTCAPRDAAHVVRQQPSAVLARIAADRKILELHERLKLAFGGFRCTRCGEPHDYPTPWPCETVRLLASPYKGREGWQEAWGHE